MLRHAYPNVMQQCSVLHRVFSCIAAKEFEAIANIITPEHGQVIYARWHQLPCKPIGAILCGATVMANSYVAYRAQALQEKGFVIVDGAVNDRACRAFAQEIAELQKQGKMHLNSTHLVRADGRRDLLQKHSIHEAEMAEAVRACGAPCLCDGLC